MGLFKSNRREIIDLTERYKRQQERLAELKAEREEAITNQNPESLPQQTPGGSFFGGFFDMTNASKISEAEARPTEQNEYADLDDPQERKRKLAKRLLDITNKLEDLGNQIYHLQQRIEVIEKKMNIGIN